MDGHRQAGVHRSCRTLAGKIYRTTVLLSKLRRRLTANPVFVRLWPTESFQLLAAGALQAAANFVRLCASLRIRREPPVSSRSSHYWGIVGNLEGEPKHGADHEHQHDGQGDEQEQDVHALSSLMPLRHIHASLRHIHAPSLRKLGGLIGSWRFDCRWSSRSALWFVVARATHRTRLPQKQKAPADGRGFLFFRDLTMTYFRMGNPYYHRRNTVSRPCSGWEGVGPARYARQECLCSVPLWAWSP